MSLPEHSFALTRRRAGSIAAVALLVLLLACGKKAAAESCDRDSDCESGTCALNFHCSPGECECTGEACGTTQSTCGEGQVCTAGQPPFDIGYNRCRTTCDGVRPCPGAKPCVGGYCAAAGIEALSWANLPRSVPCKPEEPCTYRVDVRPAVVVDTFRWRFGDVSNGAASTDTKVPSIDHVFHAGGTFGVTVTGITTNGETLPLATKEVLCGGHVGDACDLNVAECCIGSCLQGQCK